MFIKNYKYTLRVSDALCVLNMYSILVVFNEPNTARVASCWFIIYYRLVMHGNSNIKWVSSFSGMILTGQSRSTRRRTCPIAHIFVTDLTRTGLGSNRASEMRGQGLKDVIKNIFLYSSWDLPSPGILCSALWWLFTDVSEQSIGPIFKGQSSQNAWPLKMGRKGCPETTLNVCQFTLYNIPD